MDEKYDDTMGYVGPGVLHVPRGLINTAENYEGYKHDFSESYTKLGSHAYWLYNQADKDWEVKGPWTTIGAYAWLYKKLMLPHTAKVSGKENSQNNMKRRLTKASSSQPKRLLNMRRFFNRGKANMKHHQALQAAMDTRGDVRTPPATVSPAVYRQRLAALPAGHFLKRSLLNVGRMARSTRKNKYGRKKGRLFGKSRKARSARGRFRRRVNRRVGGGTRRIWRAIKKVSMRMKKVNQLIPRNVNFEYQGGHIGVLNAWTYYCPDNGFVTPNLVGEDGYVTNGTGALGWNMFTPFYNACSQINNARPYANDEYNFNYRSMKTLIQAPTNTPTFVEVFLLKPNRAGYLGAANLDNPIYQFEVGSDALTTANPGNNKAYTKVTAPITQYQAYGHSLIAYNPMQDKNVTKQRFKVTKKWKFILGPMGSKLINIKSKKRFIFRPSAYSVTQSSLVNTLETIPGYVDPADITGKQACMDYNTDSRIMIIRWHGWNTLSNDTSTNNGQLQTGMSADPIIVRRWFDFSAYKMDSNVEIDGFTRLSQNLETTPADLVVFPPYNTGQIPDQPT